MAQLKDTVVSGNLRVTDTTLTDTLQTMIIRAPSTSGGTTYSAGTSGNVLKSNGTSTYWGTLTAADVGANYSAGTGLSLSGTTFNHSNSVTEQTTAKVWKFAFDACGHITGTPTESILVTNNTNLTITPSNNAFGYVSGQTKAAWNFQQTDGTLISQYYNSSWQTEIFMDYRTGQMSTRGKNNGTWQSWRIQLDSGNWSTYCAAASHTHNYAGSSSAGGAATSANKLNTDDGSATQPVYFSNGIPVATTYALNKTVPSDAVFTDTVYTHPTYTRSNTTSTASPAHGGTFTVIDSITSNTLGHVTAVNTKTITLPADSNTDTKVTQSASTTANYRPLVLGEQNSTNVSTLANTVTNQVYTTTKIYAQPSTGNVYASTFVGKLSRSTGGTWITARDNAAVLNGPTTTANHEFYPIGFAKTNDGGWAIGALADSNTFNLTYTTDEDYDSNTNNNTYLIEFPKASGTVALTNHTHDSLTTKTLTATTLENTAGNFFFGGSNLLGGNYDWVGIQADAGNDKFQLIAQAGGLIFRQNDSGGTDSTNWNNWVNLLTPDTISGTNGITATVITSTIGSGTSALTYNSGVQIGHSNSVTAVTTAGMLKVKYDAHGHITGSSAFASADVSALINLLSTGSSTPIDADYYVSQYVGGGTTTTSYHRRPMSALWTYIKGKAYSVYIPLAGSTAISGSLETNSESAGFVVPGPNGRKMSLINGSLIYSIGTSNWTSGINYKYSETSKGSIGAYGTSSTCEYFFMGNAYDNVSMRLENDNTGKMTLRGTLPQLKFQQTTSSKTYDNANAGIKAYPADTSGMNMTIQSGGNMIIGSGEYPINFYNLADKTTGYPNYWSAGAEYMFIGSDNYVIIHTKADTIANKKTFVFGDNFNLAVGANITFKTNTEVSPVAHSLTTAATTTSRTWTLPNATGTIALTYSSMKHVLTDPAGPSGAYYGLTFHTSAGTEENKYFRTNPDLRGYLGNGTTSILGWSFIILGNATASGTAGNKYGGVRIYTSNTNYCQFTGERADAIQFRHGGGLTGAHFSPYTTNIYDLGTSTYKWRNVYATTFNGNATSADKLNTDAGSTTQPIYFSSGVPAATTYALNKTVPSDAVFTDHITTATTSGSGNAVTAISADANGALTVTKGSTFSLSTHTHAAGDVTSGTFGVARGGTGRSTLTSNAILAGNTTSAINMIATASGALYATAANGAASFGTLPIAQGGTGATTRLDALKALTDENVGTSAQYFLTITNSWDKGGYTSVANAKTVLGLGSAAYTASTDYATSGHTHSNYLGAVNANGYYGMAKPDGTTTDWIRTTNKGLIPYEAGGAGSGHQSLGTSTWYFSAAYIDTVHGSLSGNASTATTLETARSIALGSDFQGSATFDGSADITISGSHYHSNVDGGNKANYPWHRIATTSGRSGSNVDVDSLLLIRAKYNGGSFGILKISLRTNGSGAACDISARWIVRYGFSLENVVIAEWGNTGDAVYADVFLKCGVYPRVEVVQLLGSRAWTLVASNEVNNTTTSDKLTSTEVYASVASAATEIHGKAYTKTANSISAGRVAGADNADKVYSTLSDPTTEETSFIPSHLGASNAYKSLRHNDGLMHVTKNGTASVNGYSILAAGNLTASGTAGNKYGIVRIYSRQSYYANIETAATYGDNRTFTLPNATGTIALTSDIPGAGSWAAVGYSNMTDASKLSAGTLRYRNFRDGLVEICGYIKPSSQNATYVLGTVAGIKPSQVSRYGSIYNGTNKSLVTGAIIYIDLNGKITIQCTSSSVLSTSSEYYFNFTYLLG